MKAMIPWLGSALVAAVAVSAAGAQCPGGHGIRQAPDACGPGYYAPNEYSLWFGPNYNVHPCGQPFNGVLLRFSPQEGTNEVSGPGGPAGPYGPYGQRAAVPGAPGAYPAPGIPPGPYRGPYGPYPLYGPRGRMVPCGPAGGDCFAGQDMPGPVSFPTHMWARSPRDFFMAD